MLKLNITPDDFDDLWKIADTRRQVAKVDAAKLRQLLIDHSRLIAAVGDRQPATQAFKRTALLANAAALGA